MIHRLRGGGSVRLTDTAFCFVEGYRARSLPGPDLLAMAEDGNEDARLALVVLADEALAAVYGTADSGTKPGGRGLGHHFQRTPL